MYDKTNLQVREKSLNSRNNVLELIRMAAHMKQWKLYQQNIFPQLCYRLQIRLNCFETFLLVRQNFSVYFSSLVLKFAFLLLTYISHNFLKLSTFY